MRLGVFGGTFDPPHAGHRALCAAALDQLRLDRLEVIPCAQPPHKDAPRASGEQRLEMVRLAVEGLEGAVASPRELERASGASYTLTTIEELVEEFTGAELFLVLGADSYDDLPGWYEARRIVQLAHLAVAGRPGAAGLDGLRPDDLPRLREPGQPAAEGRRAVYRLKMDPYPVSASEIRERLAAGRPVPEGALTPAVAEFITSNGLYAPAGTGGDSKMTSSSSERLLQTIQTTLGERKAGRPVTLDLSGRCSFCDTFVICHGESERQVKSLADELVRAVRKEVGTKPRVEGYQGGEWILLDFGDVIVHVFSESARDFFRLESLWIDAPRVDE